GGAGACVVAGAATHHRGRLVAGTAGGGVEPALRAVPRQRRAGAAGVGVAVCGLRGVAAFVAGDREATAAVAVLAGAAGGSAAVAGVALRPAARGGAELPGRGGERGAWGRVEPGAEGSGAARRGDAVHGVAGSVQDVAVSLHGAEGSGSGDGGSGACASGTGTDHRAVCEHAGVAHGARRRTEF